MLLAPGVAGPKDSDAVARRERPLRREAKEGEK